MADEEKNGEAASEQVKSEAKKKRKKAGKKKTKKKAEEQDEEGEEFKVSTHLIIGVVAVLAVLAGIAYLMGQGGPEEPPSATTLPTAPENPNVADQYDIVEVEYTGRYTNGTVFDTSIESVAREAGIYNPARPYEPVIFTLGYEGLIPGFEEAVMDMEVGEEKTVTIPPEKGFGYPQEELIQTVDRKQTSPVVQNVSLEQFLEDVNVTPYEGLNFTVPNTSAYELAWPMEVLQVYNDTITFKYHPGSNATIETVFGDALVYSTEGEVVIEVNAEEGQDIVTLNGPAKVVDVTDDEITLDFNPPLAGKTLVFHLKLLELTKQE